MTNTEKRLEEIKQIIYGNARKGAVTDDLNQIIGFRTGEGLEFENLAKGLTEYVEDEIHQAIAEDRERVRGILEQRLLIKCECENGDCANCDRLILVIDNLSDLSSLDKLA